MAKGSTHRANLRVGRIADPNAANANTVGVVELMQLYQVTSVPLSGTTAFVLPASSRVVCFHVHQTSAFTGEATVRFGAAGATGSNLYGQISVSATNATQVLTPSTNASVWKVGASAQPIAISVVSASGGPLSRLAGHVDVIVEYFIEGDSPFTGGDY